MKLPGTSGFDPQAFQKYFKNTGWLMMGRMGSLAIKMGVSILVANYLLSYNNGVLNASLAYIYLFASIAGLGLDQFIVKELHQFSTERDRILGTAFGLKLLAGAICVPAIFMAWQIFPLQDVRYIYILILSFTGLAQSFTVIDAYFQYQVRAKPIMQVQILGNMLAAALKVLLIYYKAPLIYFIYAFLGDVVLVSLGYYLLYSKSVGSIFNWSFDRQLAKKLLGLSWPLIISGIMVSIYMKIDILMLKELLGTQGAAEAGMYTTVVSLSEALNFAPVAICSSLFPAILNARRDDPERYQKRLQNLFDLMVWISLAFAICTSIAAPWIYKLYKPEYAAAAKVLSLHVWGSIFVFLGVASSQFLIAEGYIKLTFIRTGIGAVVNIVLNLILIPRMGMMGAALATVIAYFTSTFVIIFIPQTRKQGIMILKSLFLISLFKKIFTR